MTPVLLLISSMPGCDGLGKLNKALEKEGYRNQHILGGLAITLALSSLSHGEIAR